MNHHHLGQRDIFVVLIFSIKKRWLNIYIYIFSTIVSNTRENHSQMIVKYSCSLMDDSSPRIRGVLLKNRRRSTPHRKEIIFT